MNPVLTDRSFICRGKVRGFALLALMLSATAAQAVVFQDYFTNRETILTTSGSLSGNNSTATIEVGEPRHGGKPGGHSLWVSWVAPTNGVATFDTHGSSFDTTLSAYFLGSTNDTTVDKLHEAARNDDDPGFQPTSLIQFGALAGQRYEIAVDGFQGATGSVTLNWSFISAASPPPVILSTPNDQAAKLGDTVSLAVNMTTTAGLQLKWVFYDNDVANEGGITTTNLTITSLQPTNVGVYSLRISIGNVRFFTTPVEIQINSDGSTNTLAQDKLLDSPASPLFGDDGNDNSILPPLIRKNSLTPTPGGTIGVVRGYNGSQIFNTTLATTDPAEPPHCGVTGGASYWLMYQPPTNGTITLDTIGSTYDTVMEAYTFNGALASYADLISVACDNDGVASQGASRVTFPVLKTRQYIVVVDGVAAARRRLAKLCSEYQPASDSANAAQSDHNADCRCRFDRSPRTLSRWRAADEIQLAQRRRDYFEWPGSFVVVDERRAVAIRQLCAISHQRSGKSHRHPPDSRGGAAAVQRGRKRGRVDVQFSNCHWPELHDRTSRHRHRPVAAVDRRFFWQRPELFHEHQLRRDKILSRARRMIPAAPFRSQPGTAVPVQECFPIAQFFRRNASFEECNEIRAFAPAAPRGRTGRAPAH